MIWEVGVFFLSLLNLAALWLTFVYPGRAFWIEGIFAAAGAVLLNSYRGVHDLFALQILSPCHCDFPFS